MWWHLPLTVAVFFSPFFCLCKMLKRQFKRRREVQEHYLNDLYDELWNETYETVEHYTELLCRPPKWYCYLDAMNRKDVESKADEFRAHQSKVGGVSLRYVLSNEFAELARRRTGKTDPTFNDIKKEFWLSDDPIGEDIICPRDGRPGCALVDWIPRADRRAQTHFVSWTWMYTLEMVRSALNMLKKFSSAPDRIFLSMCFFVNNQFRIILDGVSTTRSLDESNDIFESNLKRIGHMVAILDTWDQPIYMKRSWTIYEQYAAFCLEIPSTIVMPEYALEALRVEMQRGGWHGFSQALDIKCERAQTWHQHEEEYVKRKIADTVGFAKLDRHLSEAMREMLASVFQSSDFVCAGPDKELKDTLELLEEELWDEEEDTISRYLDDLLDLGMSRETVELEVRKMRAKQSAVAGVSLRYILSFEFCRLASSRTRQTNPTFNDMKEEFWLGQDPIGKDIICPRDGKPGCALVDWIPRADRREQTHFLSWTWKYTLGQLRSALEMFKMNATPARDASSIFFYICFFVNNQYRIIVDGVAAGSDDLENSFKVNLNRSGRMVAVLDTWEDPVYLKRVWTVYEQFVACSYGLPVEFVMPDASMASLQDHIRQGEWGLEKVTASICKVDSEKAEAWKPEDEEKVKLG
eukprot:s1257_g31.t1